MQDLKVSLLQTDLCWQNSVDNCAHLEGLMASLSGKTDLIVLPEMFNSGFSMEPSLIAETENGPTFEWLRLQAKKLGAAICGSLAIKTEKGYANRFIFMTPSGEYHHYDKRHLFRMGNEHEAYVSGEQRLVIEYKGWRILPQICYDLRFSVWSRNRNDYDLAIYVANWPAPRRNAWRTLLQARAIENQCYCIGVNRVGSDGNGLSYSGDSLLVDYLGELRIDHQPEKAFVESAKLSASALSGYKETFPVWLDADPFSLK